VTDATSRGPFSAYPSDAVLTPSVHSRRFGRRSIEPTEGPSTFVIT
jgi:hypothetical protein